jgi:hypothetical protein
MSTENLTVSNSVAVLTPAKYKIQSSTVPPANKLAQYALITVGGQALRLTMEGTAPVATTTGALLPANSNWLIGGYQNIAAAKMIRESGVDAPISVSYFGG